METHKRTHAHILCSQRYNKLLWLNHSLNLIIEHGMEEKTNFKKHRNPM